jgi:archaellum component FlaC
MQTQIALEKNNIVIRFPKDLISQEALSELLSFIEFKSILKERALKKNQLSELAEKIETDVTMYLDDAFLRSFENENLSDNDNQCLQSAIADGLKSQAKDAEEIFNRLENKYKTLANGVSV